MRDGLCHCPAPKMQSLLSLKAVDEADLELPIYQDDQQALSSQDIGTEALLRCKNWQSRNLRAKQTRSRSVRPSASVSE